MENRPVTLTPEAAETLIKNMVIAATEAFSLGAEANSSEIGIFRTAIPIIARAWGVLMSGEALQSLDDAIKSITENPELDVKVLGKEVLGPIEPETINSVTWALVLTLGKLDVREDREAIITLMSYMKDFWNIT